MNTAISLSGLARQLVLAGLLDEKTAQQAQIQAQRGGQSLISYVVQNKLAKGRAVAELAAEQFGVALLDLGAIDKEQQPRELVSEKLARQHRLLPLWKRGNKLFVAVSDPSNQQAINDVQFSTGLTTEGILVMSPTPIEIGKTFRLRMQLPNGDGTPGQERVEFEARSLRSSRDVNHDFIDTAFQVTSLRPRHRSHIEVLIDDYGFRD